MLGLSYVSSPISGYTPDPIALYPLGISCYMDPTDEICRKNSI